MTDLTPHFSTEEMRCPCCGKCEMDDIFMTQLEFIRNEMKVSFHVNSGFRCESHNASLKDSSPSSMHLKGLAADISWNDWDGGKKHEMLDLAGAYFHGIGIAKRYIHVDLGGKLKVWIY